MEKTDLISFLRREQREKLSQDGRWSLFDRKSPNLIHAGSLIRVTYRNSKSAKSASIFNGVLLAFRRYPSNPTMIVRTVIDEVGVEQVFSILSPLIEKIEVVKAATFFGRRKLYFLRDKPSLIPFYTLPKSKHEELNKLRVEFAAKHKLRERPKRGPRKFFNKTSNPKI